VFNPNTDETNDDGLQNVANSQYSMLFSNAPKEAHEFPDYTYNEHFQRPIPSYPPREPILNYLLGRTNKYKALDNRVRFQTYVESCTFDEQTSTFKVKTKSVGEKAQSATEQNRFEFDYVVCASGHFSTPNWIKINGHETFTGKIMHCHNLRTWEFARDKRLCVVGGSYSAEDVALQTIKNGGAKSVTICYRSTKMEFKGWPDKVNFAREIDYVEGNTIHFKSGHSGLYDMIVLCTGYKHTFDFMDDALQLKTENALYVPLYDGVVLPKNPRVTYLGMQNQLYSFPMFDIQARYVLKLMMEEITVPSFTMMEKDINEKMAEEKQLKDAGEMIMFQFRMMMNAGQKAGYPNPESMDALKLFVEWVGHKEGSITTFRDQSHRSMHGKKLWGAKPTVSWMQVLDDSEKNMLSNSSFTDPTQPPPDRAVEALQEEVMVEMGCCSLWGGARVEDGVTPKDV